ncbi:MAG: hypothetical protein AAF443_08455, partial [Chlamydiota bacterium]
DIYGSSIAIKFPACLITAYFMGSDPEKHFFPFIIKSGLEKKQVRCLIDFGCDVANVGFNKVENTVESGNLRTFGNALVEEVEFRLVLQDICLKRLPKKILQKSGVSDKKADQIVNHTVSKIARVSLSTLAFSLCHKRYFPEKGPYKVYIISSGMYYAVKMESSKTFLEALATTVDLSIRHAIWNIEWEGIRQIFSPDFSAQAGQCPV